MSEQIKPELPYKALGVRLKRVRERSSESLVEASGAVEIDSNLLGEIERGLNRPSEDVLLLLISHFGLKEDEATKLWELAGYDKQDGMISDISTGDLSQPQQVMVMPMDARIVYTDVVHVMANNYGVVMNLLKTLQDAGATTAQLITQPPGAASSRAK